MLQRIPNSIVDISSISSNTKLLITGTGENNSTSIVDMLGKTVTRYGDTKISTAQSIIGGSSIYFDGTGDYLSLADSDDWDFGSGDFTIDFWMKTSSTAEALLFGQGNSTGNGGFTVRSRINYSGQTNKITLETSFDGTNTSILLFSSATINDNAWHHITIVRNNTLFSLYIDGILDKTSTSASAFTNSSNNFSVGKCGEYAGVYYSGYLSHFRVTKGKALWTSNFTPPSSITDYSTPIYQSNANYITRTGTKLLITGNGENNSTTITDATGKTVTRYGDTKISTAQSIIGGSSIYFDGTGDYLSLADSADWAFGSGDFTVDFWIKSNTGCAVGYGSTSESTSAWKIYISSIVTAYIFYAGSNVVMLTSTSGVNATGLTHVAFVRYGSSVYLYVNGVQEDADTAQTPNSVSIDLKLGYDGGTSYLNGYLSHLRITKGQALWTSNFTPPATAGDYLIPQYSKYKSNSVELLNISNRNRIGVASDYIVTANTKLLITGTGDNNSTTITDTTGKTVTRYGDTKISTAQSIIGGSSIYFDGTGDYLSLADSEDWNFGSGDFTIDFWINFSGLSGDQIIVGQDADANNFWAIYKAITTHKLVFYWKNGGVARANYALTNAWSPTTGSWYHVSFVNSASTVYFFINGVSQSVSITTAIGTLGDIASNLYIGLGFEANTNFNGYLSYIRITKGQALWTSDFTPPKYISNNYIGA